MESRATRSRMFSIRRKQLAWSSGGWRCQGIGELFLLWLRRCHSQQEQGTKRGDEGGDKQAHGPA